jgi:hypothetical protein
MSAEVAGAADAAVAAERPAQHLRRLRPQGRLPHRQPVLQSLLLQVVDAVTHPQPERAELQVEAVEALRPLEVLHIGRAMQRILHESF